MQQLLVRKCVVILYFVVKDFVNNKLVLAAAVSTSDVLRISSFY